VKIIIEIPDFLHPKQPIAECGSGQSRCFGLATASVSRVISDFPVRSTPSQRAQIVRHVAELSQHSRIAEIASSWITSPAKRDGTCVWPNTFQRPCARSIAAAGLGHSIGSPTTTLPSATSNGSATKYVMAMACHPGLMQDTMLLAKRVARSFF
jgi:hypothetical protein